MLHLFDIDLPIVYLTFVNPHTLKHSLGNVRWFGKYRSGVYNCEAGYPG